MYLLDQSSFSKKVLITIMQFNAVVNNSIDPSHLMLGHASFDSLSYINSINLEFNSLTYEVCPQAKQRRLSFHKSQVNTTYRLQMVHVDVWGPYRQPTLNGACYFLTIIDDFTRVAWLYLLRNKSEVANDLENFLNLTFTQYSAVTKIVRSDNGWSF